MLQEFGDENIYYQDESGFDEYFTRRHGYGLNGAKVHTQLSGKRYERQSIMALRNHNHKLVEPMIYLSTADSNTVLSYFEHTLPRLQPTNKTRTSIVILDNASYHKSQQLKDLFKQHNCHLVFLPPYSPDLNPIEPLWGTIKQDLRNFYDYTLDLFHNLCNSVVKYSV